MFSIYYIRIYTITNSVIIFTSFAPLIVSNFNLSNLTDEIAEFLKNLALAFL